MEGNETPKYFTEARNDGSMKGGESEVQASAGSLVTQTDVQFDLHTCSVCVKATLP